MKMRAYRCDRGLLLATVLVLAGVAGCWSEEAVYSVTDLGTLGDEERVCRQVTIVLGTFFRRGPMDMNNLGQVVGLGAGGAFLWLPAPAYGLPAGMTYLGTLGGNGSWPRSINDCGQIIGEASTAEGSVHVFLWEDGGMTDLSVLADGKDREAVFREALEEYRPGLLSPSDAVSLESLGLPNVVWLNGVLLNTAPPEQPSNVPLQVVGSNDTGQAIGMWGLREHQGFVWKWGFPIRVPSRMASAQPGWALTDPFVINDSGRIAGCGTFEGETHYFLAQPQLLTGLHRGSSD